MSTADPTDAVTVEVVTEGQGKALFDARSRELTGLSGDEVLALFDSGEAWDRFDHGTASTLSMLIPFAREVR